MATRFEPSPIRIGYYFDGEDVGAPNLFAGERHLLIFGLNGAGKSTRFLIENLVTLKNRSLVVFDVKGELAAQTARARRQFGDVKIINPYGVVGLPSDGYNPLAILDPDNENEFSDRAAMLADAIIELEGKDPYWSESAQGLMQAGIMWEVQEARNEDRAPSLFRVRQLLTEADESGPGPGGKRVLVKGLAINAARMVAEGGEIIASLVGRFLREHGQNELSGIQSTFDTQTRFLLSPPLARDLEKGEGDCFRQLRDTPTTVYIVLPPAEISRKRRWTRLLITSALCEHMRPGPVKTLFVLDEFRASVGHLQIINDVWSLVRGYGIQLMPVVQSATQLKALYKDEWENFAAQAGAVVTIGPPNDLMTANWMSEISGNETIWQDSQGSNQSWTQQGGMNISEGLNYQQAERRFLLPQELRSMAVGTGRIWTPGMGESSIPFFAPNWWKRRELMSLVEPNPYYGDASASSAVASSAAPSTGAKVLPFVKQIARETAADIRKDGSIPSQLAKMVFGGFVMIVAGWLILSASIDLGYPWAVGFKNAMLKSDPETRSILELFTLRPFITLRPDKGPPPLAPHATTSKQYPAASSAIPISDYLLGNCLRTTPAVGYAIGATIGEAVPSIRRRWISS